jgi:RNA polymerase sigma factor (TIGR02999 family)
LLTRVSEGDEHAVSRLIPLVYDELRQIAARHMRRERLDHTLQTTALVHEVYLRLVKQRAASWQNRAHFFAVAAKLMRQILVDHARHNLRVKRGGRYLQVSLDQAMVLSEIQSAKFLALDEALGRLQKRDARQSQIVELKYFGGLTTEETAEVLKTSPRTVEREWEFAKSWLYMQLRQDNGSSNRNMEQD